MKFRKKPVVVDAEQFTGPYPLHAGEEIPGGVPVGIQWLPPTDHAGFRWPFVVTAHGQETRVAAGDWIITEPDGRGYYPCKSDVFLTNYEPVN